MAYLADSIWVIVTSSGLADFTVSSELPGYRSFAQAMVPNGAVVHYTARTATEFENGEGTYNSGTGVVSRTTIFASSTGGAKVSFATPPTLAISPLAEDLAAFADGDKGDVTVSSSGTVWTIDPGAVTYAKVQDVSAGSKLLGRGDSGPGDMEEIALGTGLTMAGTTLNASGVGDVTAAAPFADDNRIVRTDVPSGVSKGVQTSGASITDSGQMLIGTTALQLVWGWPSMMQAAADSNASFAASCVGYGDNQWGTGLVIAKGRGALGALTPVLDGDQLGLIAFVGQTGGTYLSDPGAEIDCTVEGTVSAGIVPSRLGFWTCDSAGFTLERVRITSSGSVDVLGSTSGQISLKTQAAAGTYNWNWPTTAGSPGQVLTSQGGGATAMTWSSPAGTGDVTAAAVFGADNRLIRSDGAGKGVQWGAALLDDANNLSLFGQLTIAYANATALIQGTGTSFAYLQVISATGGTPFTTRVGTEGPASNQLFVGTAANASVFGSVGNAPVQFATNNAVRGGFASSGEFNVLSKAVVGATAPIVATGTILPNLQVHGVDSTSGIVAGRWDNAAGAPIFYFTKSRSGTVGSHVIVQGGDVLGQLQFRGSDGTAFQVGAQIRCEVDGTPGLNDMPGRLIFQTTPDGTNAGVERLRIDNAGVVSVANQLTVPNDPISPTWSGNLSVPTKGSIYATVRERLLAPRTYYVATTGSDANTGLAPGTPFLTVQKAIDLIGATLDLGGQTVTIQLADGTYTGGVLFSAPWQGGGLITIQGNAATPGNVIISTTSNHCFNNTGVMPGVVTIKDMRLQSTTTGSAIRNFGVGTFTFSGIDFGPLANNCLNAGSPAALIRMVGNCRIVGNVQSFASAQTGGYIEFILQTLTLVGTPAFATAFAFSGNCAILTSAGMTFSGAATGKRYQVQQVSIIDTAGSGINYFPGNAIGTADATTFGSYV